jgi:hypothetical protein
MYIFSLIKQPGVSKVFLLFLRKFMTVDKLNEIPGTSLGKGSKNDARVYDGATDKPIKKEVPTDKVQLSEEGVLTQRAVGGKKPPPPE